MANLHFITTLLLCLTLLRVNGQSIDSSSSSMFMSMSSVSMPDLMLSTSASPSQNPTPSSSSVSPISQSTSSIRATSTTVVPTATITPSSTTSTTQPKGYDIKYEIKDGECERVCCDKGEGAAGGPVKMIPICTPQSDDSQCKDEKEESGHCPGDPDDRCSAICSAFSVQCPSFALLGLLAVATFFKFGVC